MRAPSYTVTKESVTVIWNGKAHTIQKGSPNFAALKEALIQERWDDVPQHLETSTSLKAWAKGKVSVSGDQISVNGIPVPDSMNDRIMKMATNQEKPEALFFFWERLSQNPSYRSVNQLWEFLKHSGIPITKDGHILAYKSVRSDYKDVHSGTFDNSPGSVNEMPRNQISDDPKVACHVGFHVGALSYAQSFGGSRIVICKVDPKDVVCVPYDESNRKMRVCRYEVIGNMGSTLPDTVYMEDADKETPDSSAVLESVKKEEKKALPAKSSKKDKKAKKKEIVVSDKAAATTEPTLSKAAYDKMDMTALMKVPIEDLRRYARSHLHIIGASKIPGGKTALVTRIMDVRS